MFVPSTRYGCLYRTFHTWWFRVNCYHPTKADYLTYGVLFAFSTSGCHWQPLQVSILSNKARMAQYLVSVLTPHLLIHILNTRVFVCLHTHTHKFTCIIYITSPILGEFRNDPQHPLLSGRWVRVTLGTVKWLLLNVANTTRSQTRQEQMGWWCGKRRHQGLLRDVS